MSTTPSVINRLYYFKKNRIYTTIEFKVFGHSVACKTRIENALKVNGIKNVKWNIDTMMLTAIFNHEIVTIEQIQACFSRERC